jgi:hypothetical protein
MKADGMVQLTVALMDMKKALEMAARKDNTTVVSMAA